MIRDIMEMEYGNYRYLGNGIVSYKKGSKTKVASFNDVYNTLLDYGVEIAPAKVKETLNKINE